MFAHRGAASCVLLDGIQCRDAFYGFSCNGRALGDLHIDELAPDVRHARHLMSVVGLERRVEAAVAIGMDMALEARKVFGRMLDLAIGRETVPGTWRFRAAEAALVGNIGPHTGCRHALLTGRLHLDRRVIGKDRGQAPSVRRGHPTSM